jgi:hypothetical protein
MRSSHGPTLDSPMGAGWSTVDPGPCGEGAGAGWEGAALAVAAPVRTVPAMAVSLDMKAAVMLARWVLIILSFFL